MKERLLVSDIWFRLGAIRARKNVGDQVGVSISRNCTSHDKNQHCTFFFFFFFVFWQEVIELHIDWGVMHR